MLNAAEPITDDQRATIVGSLEQTWANMMAAARALDPAGVRAGYEDRPTVAINGLIVEDFNRRFEETERWLGSLRQLDASYDNVHLEVLGPTAAVATMNHHLRWIDTSGTTGEWNSAWTAVFRQSDGRWKIVYSHESVLPDK
jgi:ketosteroid isomerase-like protein